MYVQVLNEASQLAATNFSNHITCNLFNRTRRWLAYRMYRWQHPYFTALSSTRLQSWLTLLLRASTNADHQGSILQLLPRFTSLEQPPPAVLRHLQSLVLEVRQNIGPRPVTTSSVARQPQRYLPWLYKILADLRPAQEHLLSQRQLLQLLVESGHLQQQHQQQLQSQLHQIKKLLPQTRLFTLLPQKSNKQQFVTISTACLHR